MHEHMPQPSTLFSPDYNTARARFLQAAASAGASIQTSELSCGQDLGSATPNKLAIDVATIGPEASLTVLVSSGLHGVEGFFGSAIQLAILEQLAEANSTKANSETLGRCRVVLVHALNPFGFSEIRRTNEDNVDLNRNFVSSSDDYLGAPTAYTQLDKLLNPSHAPKKFDFFLAKALFVIARHGMQSIKQAVAGGQYEFPRGLFFGGHRPSETMRIVQRECTSWVGSSSHVTHIDLHSGLGAFGSYRLLLNATESASSQRWYANKFGSDHLETMDGSATTAYRVSGMFGEWMQERFKNIDYRFAGAEFGTYSPLRVIAALRKENQLHHHTPATPANKTLQPAKAELLECFCPSDTDWRTATIATGLKIFGQACTNEIH